ncbi:hypothetical protein DL98DRAFT_471531 [Cadophora sp. DSE1049]|nr:hypothetical protein DL98DRAFT_471531 [Cadophora sp. DSE1049]
MDGSPPPLLSPSIPRFAPPRTHTRTPSRSPTRHRLADDILSDLSPATTLEAFTNPSGKLKASIEAATPSERAFGLRATLASKKIQEWVDELSGWPWPAEGGSLGFEIPSAKRRKLSIQGDDRGRRNSNGYTQEPKYIGSLLETEVERYENRIDDITADMEDLNVEEIKRQVLDTHFSPRSRPSSSASNAPPMPSLFASYTRMDDFTAVITATVLQSLPNLSRLTRLMDVWNIRLSVLRKVPPLMVALDDAEIALKSGWTAIDKPDASQNPQPQTEDPYLTRKAFEIMREVLQDKVTTLGQDLDYMLDTLEGREDTLPDSWLDRMETLENDYGSWVVSGDRKVREGEWARMAKARKEEDDARKLREAQAAETARRKAEEQARLKAQLDAEEAETARLKAEQEAQDAARPPNSPPPGVAKRPSLFLPTTPGLSPSTNPSTPLPDSMPSTPLDAPVFGNIDVSTIPIISSPKKSNTDDQMQQQISSLLESIPARIRLTTEPNEIPFTSQTLRPKKTRRSITPSFRSSSSMSNYSTSSRAPTPSFTLAPAFGKTSSRPRPQSSNPEIKLYHLSRSTGEAPIKLFVRLVGEHGERVMVRVGGGWADLGEYLKEYASHHGRRSAVDAGDKVQIQDLPSRNVSSSSTATLRAPTTAYDSSRAPSTPLPSTSSLHRNLTSTPPSTTSSTSTSGERDRTARSSSRLSWTSDDGKATLALGLAGPKSKNVTISERDQEWVESMKEKVRLASAEKEKRERSRASFGEMEKVGGTKRLFRKGL